ncbi:hypothetical protein ACI2KS_09460 [Pseudomonas sp. NPDC087358]
MSIASARSTADVDCFCPQGVGVRLADDLARSVSKPETTVSGASVRVTG